MPTNLLSLPQLEVAFETRTNESWRDSVAFVTAGSIAAYRNPANAGSGMPAGLTVQPGAYIGNYTITFSDPNTFVLADPDGNIVGAGSIFAPFTADGISFTLLNGVTAFAQGDIITLIVLPQFLDLTGIRFVMQMRQSVPPQQVLVQADTDDGTMVNGGASGVIGLAIPADVMSQIPPSPDGAPYALDYIAIADGDQRCCVIGSNTVVAGVTSPVGQ